MTENDVNKTPILDNRSIFSVFHLNIQDWSFKKDGSLPVDKSFEVFLNNLVSAVEIAFPMKTYADDGCEKPAVHWYTDELRQMRQLLEMPGALRNTFASRTPKVEVFSFREVSFMEVRDAISQLEDSTPLDYYGLTSIILKRI
ncbi:hypothetical protein WA026_014238 [Henosepilachna vigintioctopunctata]|uniref:Uncharacterized protein n=1 Tax=Henosepilachna vigintioctopunctata TaxID=420089 RepID=A0AAW1TSX4_9CUCU